MRVVASIPFLIVVLATNTINAQETPPNAAPNAPRNRSPESAWYSNHSLIGTYHISYISGRRGGGEISYDGNGNLSGHDRVYTFDGTYSVNPDGTGTAAMYLRTEDGAPIWPKPLKSMGQFRIHPGGGIEFESISSDGYMAGTEHKIEKSY
jgi:hypothetical protein